MKKMMIIGLIGIVITSTFFILKYHIESEVKKGIERKTEIESGDLLALYGKKPEHLIFKELVIGKGQIRYDALYEVEGKHSKTVEDFLVKKYGMGKLKWVCCGYENTNGQKGQITVELDDENNFDLMIGMYAYADITDENDNENLKFEREKLNFTVSVQLIYHNDF